jgi:ElaB/YqjD/DUF883 family membrane-anchored ribosome-binding protein
MEKQNGRNADAAAQSIRERAQDVAGSLQAKADGAVDQAREYAGDINTWVRDFAREKPVMAIACAIGIGFVVGRLASKT